MGRNEFYAWVEQAARENGVLKADDPGSFDGTEHDPWWEEARRKREEMRGR